MGFSDEIPPEDIRRAEEDAARNREAENQRLAREIESRNRSDAQLNRTNRTNR